MKTAGLLTCIILAMHARTFADIKLSPIFGDGMVLQREMPISIWGTASPGESFTLFFHDQEKQAIAGPDGSWHIQLAPEPAGGPFTLLIKGNNIIMHNDIWVGDVWVCAGQSNMEWTVRNAAAADLTIATANQHTIRHTKISTDVSGIPLMDLKRQPTWNTATPDHVGQFTAVGYYFSNKIQQAVDVPIGLINITWGGTIAEAWISRTALQADPGFAERTKEMPSLPLDTLQRLVAKRALDRVEALQSTIPNQIQTPAWEADQLDDTSWPTMMVPDTWENQQLTGLDGIVWFRRNISLTDEQAQNHARLHLGKIDDNDVVFINGVSIGSTTGHQLVRMYTVPQGVLRPGENTITIRVEDNGGDGGFTGTSEELTLDLGNDHIPLSGAWRFQVERIFSNTASVGPNNYPSLIYNAMVHPLTRYGIKGIIWYQGESNTKRAYEYRKTLPLLIRDWRAQWGIKKLPFYFVQLSSYKATGGTSQNGSPWAELREAQTKALKLSETGMAVTIDIGERDDIHPLNKQDVGERLARVALARTYHKSIAYKSALYKRFRRKGDKIVVYFSDSYGRLAIANGHSTLLGFEIAGDDQVFKPAKAIISGNRVILQNTDVRNPVAVRYGWADDAGACNLINGAALPTIPFRSDNWQSITQHKMYNP